MAGRGLDAVCRVVDEGGGRDASADGASASQRWTRRWRLGEQEGLGGAGGGDGQRLEGVGGHGDWVGGRISRGRHAVGGVAWGPQEEDLARCFYHFGVRSEWLLIISFKK
jgi:hypothetical protein